MVRMLNKSRELLDYLGKLVDKRIAEPKNDVTSTLITEQACLPLGCSRKG